MCWKGVGELSNWISLSVTWNYVIEQYNIILIGNFDSNQLLQATNDK